MHRNFAEELIRHVKAGNFLAVKTLADEIGVERCALLFDEIYGSSALHWCATMCNRTHKVDNRIFLDMGRWMIEHGFDPKGEEKEVVTLGCDDIFEFRAHTPLDRLVRLGWTALPKANVGVVCEFIDMLVLENGADINRPRRINKMERGVDRRRGQIDGLTPLYTAVSYAYVGFRELTELSDAKSEVSPWSLVEVRTFEQAAASPLIDQNSPLFVIGRHMISRGANPNVIFSGQSLIGAAMENIGMQYNHQFKKEKPTARKPNSKGKSQIAISA